MKASKPILKIVPPSPWLKNTVNGIRYWVHVPSRKCGIHVSGLAELCGVTEGAIRKIIRNAKKTKGEVRTLRESETNNLLKDKTIFLEEVRTLSPIQQGGPVKVICSDVCADLITYFS